MSKDSINHVNFLVLTPNPGFFNGNVFSRYDKKTTLIFSNVNSVGPGIFQLDSIPKKKFYLILMTQINHIDLEVENDPVVDLSKVTGSVAEFDYTLARSFVRRYYDLEK